MNYRTLGRTGLRVSEIGFGAGTIGSKGWGSDFDDTDSKAALERALELGINYIDTSDAYGNGHSEELIGEVVKGKRDKVIIATKFGNNFYPFLEKAAPGSQPIVGDLQQDFSPKHTRFALEQSLKRLQTDYVDLYQLHSPSQSPTLLSDCFETLEQLKKDGKIRFIGVSLRLRKVGMEHGHACLGIKCVDALQMTYNMMDLDPEESSLLASAKAANAGVIARVPLNYGMLADKWTVDTVFPDNDQRKRRFQSDRQWWEKAMAHVAKLRFLKKNSKNMAQAAFRYLLAQDAVSVIIGGVKRPQQAEDNAAASDVGPLSLDEVKEVRRLWREYVQG